MVRYTNNLGTSLHSWMSAARMLAATCGFIQELGDIQELLTKCIAPLLKGGFPHCLVEQGHPVVRHH